MGQSLITINLINNTIIKTQINIEWTHMRFESKYNLVILPFFYLFKIPFVNDFGLLELKKKITPLRLHLQRKLGFDI